MPHTYTMELVPLEETEPINFIIQDDCPFLNLPRELIDKIIFYNPPKTIGALKNSCHYLSSLASLLRIDKQHIRNFTIPEEAQLDLFKNIVKTDNPEYIKKILGYGRKEAHFHHQETEDSTVIIPQDESLIEKAHLHQNYLPFLLQYAIEQNKYNSVHTLTTNGADTIARCYVTTPLEHAAQHDSDKAIQALLDCTTFNEEQLDEALHAAWWHNTHKALELLSKTTGNYEYLDRIKKKRCDYCSRVTYTATMVTLLLTAGTIGITFQILRYLPHNATMHNVSMH